MFGSLISVVTIIRPNTSPTTDPMDDIMLKMDTVLAHWLSTEFSITNKVDTGTDAIEKTWKDMSKIMYSWRFPTKIISASDTKEPIKAIRMNIFRFPRESDRFPQKISAITEAVDAAAEVIP